MPSPRLRASVDAYDRDSSSRRTGVIRRIRDDLRRGQNLELYVTVSLALVVGGLGVFDVVEGRVVAAATLAVLALLAVSGVAARHQLEDVRSMVAGFTEGDVQAERYLSSRAPLLNDEVASAMQICLVGVTLTRTVRNIVTELDDRLRAGAVIRVIVIDPDSDAPAQAAARITNKSFFQPKLTSTIDLLMLVGAAAPAPANLQVRLLPFVPAFGMCLLDAQSTNGRAFVEVYQHKSLEHNPQLALHAGRDGRWFQFFVRQFEALWESARPLPADPSAAQEPS